MPSVHDPSFAQRGDQAVRSVYGRMIPVRPPSPERKRTPCWQHRRRTRRSAPYCKRRGHPTGTLTTQGDSGPHLRRQRTGSRPSSMAWTGSVHRLLRTLGMRLALQSPSEIPLQASGNAKLDRRDYHPSQHGTGRSVGIIKSSAWDGGPPSRERAAEIATPGYYPFGAGTVLMGSMPTEELSRLFRMYNGRVPPPIRRGATSL